VDVGGVAVVAKCLETRAARFVTETIERSIREDGDWDDVREGIEEGGKEREEEGGGACLVGGASVADVRRGAEQRVRAMIGQAVGSSRRVNGAAVRIPCTRMLFPGSIEREVQANEAETLPTGQYVRSGRIGEAYHRIGVAAPLRIIKEWELSGREKSVATSEVVVR
jgi:hypothetical protein